MSYEGAPPKADWTADVCIIGAGVAGLALALQLRRHKLRILLLESGDLRHAATAQELNEGVSEDAAYPFVGSRSRGFGGTSRLWYGACIPLDPIDFAPRPWLPLSGWPISADTLAPHYEATRPLFSLPDLATAAQDLRDSDFHGGGLEAKVVAHSNPLDLGKRHWNTIQSDPNITCRLEATVTGLHVPGAGDRVTHLDVRSSAGDRVTVAATHVVLACGGIENARLLLASSDEVAGGIGNRQDVVGRYHMEHPMRAVGVLPVGEKAGGLCGFTNRGTAGAIDVIGTLGLSRDLRERHGLLDMHLRVFRFHPLESTVPVRAGKEAARRLAARQTDGTRETLRLLQSAISPASLTYLAWHIANKMNDRAPFDHVRFTAFLEQEPQAGNRITLSSRMDRFGRPLPLLTWSESDFMRDSHQRSLDLLEKTFLTQGFGRFVHSKEEIGYLSGYNQYGLHHMGSTRMHDDPRFGVVDRDCKVHGMANLFIAGSSVFPTGGAANPTWTIAALANRLADHIAALHRTGPASVPEPSSGDRHE